MTHQMDEHTNRDYYRTQRNRKCVQYMFQDNVSDSPEFVINPTIYIKRTVNKRKYIKKKVILT